VPASRDFVPWRFSDAGRRSAWIASSCRHPKTCTKAVLNAPNVDFRSSPNRAVTSEKCHVWTAPAVQEESDISAKRSGAALGMRCLWGWRVWSPSTATAATAPAGSIVGSRSRTGAIVAFHSASRRGSLAFRTRFFPTECPIILLNDFRVALTFALCAAFRPSLCSPVAQGPRSSQNSIDTTHTAFGFRILYVKVNNTGWWRVASMASSCLTSSRARLGRTCFGPPV